MEGHDDLNDVSETLLQDMELEDKDKQVEDLDDKDSKEVPGTVSKTDMEGPEDSDSDEERCGMKRPNLLEQLKTILDTYPDDAQIIKELIQNAEDANATEMKLLHDKRKIQPEGDLGQYFKAPALCVYNDAEFTEDDWEGIISIYNSVKKNDKLKVGRFGLGFKSVFHMTDHPVIISGDKLLIIDPLQSLESEQNVCDKKRLKNLAKPKYRKSIAHLENVFGLNENVQKGKYNGTFFWFPLREKPSALSDNIYTEQKMDQLFDTFEDEAQIVLLFLKSLLKIEALCRSDVSSERIKPLHAVSMVGVNNELEKRTAFKDEVLNLNGELPVTSIWSTYEVTITMNKDGDCFEMNWIIVNYIQGTTESQEKLTSLAQDPDLSYSPYVGIAYPCQSDESIETGHIFCFLPLPLEKKSLTGLPVHVNGLFALEQNRRHVKWGNRDQSHVMISKDKHVLWNEIIIRDVLSKAYEHLFDFLVQKSKGCQNNKDIVNSVIRSIPMLSQTSYNWDILLKELIPLLLSKEIFFTENEGGKWIAQSEALFPLFSPPVASEEEENTITKFVLQARKNLVALATNMKEMLVDKNYNGNSPCGITPVLLREILHSCNVYTTFSREEKLFLLSYAASDKEFSQLDGIELLPLDNGTFVSFQSATYEGSEKIFLCGNGEEKIFLGLENRLVSTEDQFSDGVIETLHEIAENGAFQLKLMTGEDFPYLYKKTLEKNCEKFEETRNYMPTSDSLDLVWLERVWKYINSNFDLNGDADILHMLPLLTERQPGKESIEKLLPLKGFYLVGQCDGICTLSPKLDQVLSFFSITKLQLLPDFLKSLLGTFVHYPNHESIFQLLSDIMTEIAENQITDTFNSKSQKSDRDALVEFLSEKTTDIPVNLKSMFRNLGIFLVAKETVGMAEKSSEYTTLNQNNLLVPEIEFPIPYPYPLIGIKKARIRDLALALGAQKKEENELVKDTLEVILNETQDVYTVDEVQHFMKYFLTNITIFDDTLLQMAKRVAFIPSPNSNIFRAMDLFDPRDEQLQVLFHREDKFPEKNYNSDDTLNALLKIGLKKSGNVTFKDILETAKILDTLSFEQMSEKEEFLAKAEKLKYFLNALDMDIDNDILDELKELHWVPVLKRPESYPECLPWYSEDTETILSTPRDVISSEFYFLSGSVQSMVDVREASAILEKFQWNQPPTESTISEQLNCISICFEPKHRPKLLPAIAFIYEHLSKLDSVYEHFQDTNCILCEDTFKNPSDVYINEDKETETLSLYPYMSKLPTEFIHLEKLFLALGCKETLTTDIFINVLEKIKKKHSKKSKSKKNVKSDLRLVIQIVKHLDDLNLPDTKLKDVLLPVLTRGDHLVLKYPSECTYADDDTEWLFDASDEENIIEDDIFYVHKEIDSMMAIRFGVPSLTNRFLTEDDSEEMVMEWGQSEPLTTRLNNLLEGYADGFTIPKEMVQNADDAGATEVAFLYDERENRHARSRLIDPQMADCQGPALWAFNNSVFQESDFRNIIKLGGRTKEMDEATIGKFGLGFCSVYNLTDVPSFYSGNSMVIFDPHGQYLGKALKNKENPGLRFKLNQKILKCLQNQFQPFNGVFDCDLSGNARQQMDYKGTLFRFPLRTKLQAAESKIKDLHYSRKEMLELLEIFTRSAGDLLLFTQSIRTIKVYHLPPTSSNPTERVLLFSADKFDQMSIPKHMDGKPVLKYFILNQEEKLSVVNHFKISINVTDHMQRLCKGKASCNSTQWLVAWGSSEDWIKAIKGGVPVGATALPVSMKDEKLHPAEISTLPDGFYKSSHLFCFLPLPVELKLLYHLNGCFSVEQDRKCLTRTSDDDKTSEKVTWNNAILSGAVCNSFLNLLIALKELVSETEYDYSLLWPRLPSNEKDLADFFVSFYQNVVQGDYPVLCQGGQWYSFKECCFLDPFLRFNKDVGDMAFDCILQFAEDRNVMDIRDEIIKCLHAAECSQSFEERVVQTEVFYRDIFFKNISSEIWQTTEKKALERDCLTIFALKSSLESLMGLVKSSECIPTTGNGTLRKPEDLVHPNMLAATLFDDGDGRFPTKLFCQSDSLDALSELGMKTDLIPFEWLKERAETIKSLDRDMALERCKSLLEYLRVVCVDKRDHGYNLLELSDIDFLPIEKKPANWPLTWKGEIEVQNDRQSAFDDCDKNETDTPEQIFACPKNLFMPKLKSLIGGIELIVYTFETHRFVGILNAVGVNSSVAVDALIQQLDLVSECAIENMEEAEKKQLEEICSSIYKYMNEWCKDDKKQGTTQNFDTLKSKKILLTSDTRGNETLITPSAMAFERPLDSYSNFDCRPYLFFVSPSLKKYDEFLKTVGVREQFSSSFILGVIEELKEKLGTEPCSDSDAELIVNIIKLLNGTCKVEKMSLTEDQIKNLIVPDDECVMRSPCDLCYDEDYGTLGKMSCMHFVHTSVDVGLMKLLGIKSKRVQHLRSFAGAMDFGQREKLVTRLKGLLEGYPFDSTILNELLQNADDASASEIHFILDERTHSESGIFEDSWKPLQGPSLLVYNDTCFTKSDIQGIQNLGEGNKSDDPTKTGQFGLGFNATYHLTDVPSFLTRGPDTPNGGTLCIFDPHCNYAPLARPDSPGMQLPDLGIVKKHYPGVYNTYLQKELPSKIGTWFRFPLRDREMSKKSEICKNKVVTVTDIDKLYDSFLKDMQRALLFVSNVQEIKLSRITKRQTNFEGPFYRVKASLTDDDKQIRTCFNQYVKESMTKLKEGKCLLSEIPSQEAVYRISVEDSSKQRTNWIVVQRFGISNGSSEVELLIKAVKDGEIGLSPRGGIALPMIDETILNPLPKEKRPKAKKKQKLAPTVDAVLVYREMLKSLNYQQQINIGGKKGCTLHVENMLQVPGKKSNTVNEESMTNISRKRKQSSTLKTEKMMTASGKESSALLEEKVINDRSEKKTKINEQAEIGDFRVFCFLPTPIRSGLPLHINGHFALDPARRNMHREGDNQSIRGEWNRMILNDIIPKAYVRGMEGLKDYLMGLVFSRLISPCNAIEIFHLVFPNQEDLQENIFEKLVNCVYENILKREVSLFPIQNYLSTVSSEASNTVAWVPLCAENHAFPAYFNDLQFQFINAVDLKYKNKRSTSENVMQLQELQKWEKKQAKEASLSLSTLLKNIGLKLVDSPVWIMNAINKASIQAECVLPDHVTNFIKSHLDNFPDRFRIEVLESESSDVVLQNVKSLLSYCLKGAAFLENMEKLPLLVTEDNELHYFSSSNPVFVSSFCKLLPESKNKFANANLVDLLHGLVGKSASLQVLDIKSFATILPLSVNGEIYQNRSGVCLKQKQENDTIPNKQWLDLFWEYLSTRFVAGHKENVLEVCRTVMKDWCFIPGEEHGQEILVSFQHGHRLINLHSFSDMNRKRAFTSLQLPKPDIFKFADTKKYFVASEQDAVSVLNCLHYSVQHLSRLEMDDGTCDEILKYLHGALSMNNDTETKLRRLPLYKSISGTRTSLDIGKEMLILPSEVPTTGLDIWSQKAERLLLKRHFIIEPLLVALGAKQCDALQFYGLRLLPKMNLLDKECIMDHLEYIRDEIISKHKVDNCMEVRQQLKLIKFIPSYDENNILVTADTFYSPFNSVCRKMCQENEFPPPPFNSKKWKKFMDIAGMKSEITEELFIKFAKQIEDTGVKKGVTRTVKEQSEELVSHMFNDRNQLARSNLLERIKHIKFIVPHAVVKCYVDIYPVRKQSSLICFSKSVSHRFLDLSWTVCSLLPAYADPELQKHLPEQEQIERRLEIYTKPQIDDVISHTKNICPSLHRRFQDNYQKRGAAQPPDKRIVNNIMIQIYDFFNKNGKQIIKEELCETPVIHLYELDLFCTAEQVVLDISSEDQILPYLFKAPVEYGAYFGLFKFLGSKDTLTCQHYANVLKSQKEVVQENCLSPEDIRATRKAVLGFFKEAQKNTKQLMTIQHLYLLGEDNKLHKAASLIHCNKKMIKPRLRQLDIQFLRQLDFPDEKVNVENVLTKLPDHIRPKFLTDLVTEELVQVSRYDIVDNNDGVSAVKGFICSSQFLKVVCHLVRRDNHKASDHVTDEQLTGLRQNIQAIEFYAVRRLETLLRYKGQVVEGSRQQAHCYYTTTNGSFEFYFKEGTGDISKRIRSRLARLILQCTNNLISQSFNTLSEVVGLVPDTDLIAQYLTEHEINIDTDFDNIEDEWLPPLGSFVPKHEYILLDNSFTEFRTGEYVAYEVYDPEIDGNETDSFPGDMSDPVYIYVKVVEKCNSGTDGDMNPYLVKYKVNMGHGRVENVYVIRMYKFVHKSSTDLVKHTGTQSTYSEAREEAVMEGIRKTLIQAWKLDEKSRKRIIKRLYLIWHPDKNKGNEEFCTKVFQYIQEIIRQLENGEININSGSGPSYSSWNFSGHSRSRETYAGSWYSTFGENVNRRYHSSYTCYSSYYSSRRHRRRPQTTEYVPNPQAYEARRWLKQAKDDLVVAMRMSDCKCENLEDTGTSTWICFICHQAAEKAIKALTYSIDANKVTRTHQLREAASDQPRDTLREKASKLDDLLCNYNQMRYPDALHFPKTPSQLYDAEKAKEAIRQAQEIVEEVDEHMTS